LYLARTSAEHVLASSMQSLQSAALTGQIRQIFDVRVGRYFDSLSGQLRHAKQKGNRSQAGVWLVFRRGFARSVLNVVAGKCA